MHLSMTTRPLLHLIPAWCGTPRTPAFPSLAGHRSSRIRLASELPTIYSGMATRCCAAALASIHGRSRRTTSEGRIWCPSDIARSRPALNHLSDVASYTPGNLGAFNGDSSFGFKKGDNNIPYTQNWNIILSRQMPWKSTLEAQYAGNRTRNALLTGNGSNQNFFQNINKIPLGALYGPDPVTGAPCPANPDKGLPCDPDKWSNAQLQDFRPYSNYGKALIEVTHGRGR